jgi:hypothetical protein
MSRTVSSRDVVWIVVAALAVGSSGVVGAVIALEIVLLRIRPRERDVQAARLLGLTACTTTLVAGVIGGFVGLARGWDYPPTAWFAFIEGGVIGGAVGLVLGVCVGVLLATDHLRQPTSA